MGTSDSTQPGDDSVEARAERLARWCAGACAALGGGVFLGWLLDLAQLKSLDPVLVSMKPNTAVCFMLSGLALWPRPGEVGAARRVARLALGLLVASVGAATLTEHVAGWDLGFDRLLFRHALDASATPGRMAPASSVSFTLAGLALLVSEGRARANSAIVTGLAMIIGLLSLTAMVGYFDDLAVGYAPRGASPIALHTAAGLWLLSWGLLLTRPSSGVAAPLLAAGETGRLVRRFLPLATLTPVLLGWLLGLGARAGLYDAEFKLTLVTTLSATGLATLTWWGARRLMRLEESRENASRERALAEQRFKRFFENAPIGKSMTAPDGRFLMVNEAFAAMLGYSVPEIQAIDFAQVTHPDDLAESRECIRALMAGERDTWTMEKRYRARDGHLLWALVVTRLERDAQGAPLHFLTHVQDITRRKALEQELRQARDELEQRVVERTRELAASNQLLDETGRLARVGGWEIDVATRQFHWSEVVRQIHEVEHDYRPSFEEGVKFYVPEALPVISQAVRLTLKEGTPFDLELQLLTAKQRRVWVRALGAAIIRDGKVEGVRGVFQDIDQRKLAELELIKYREHLEELVEQRTAELKATQLDLVDAQAVGRVGTWAWSVVEDRLSGSDEFWRLLEARPGDLTRFAQFTARLHPDDRDTVASALAAALAHERDYDVEFRVGLADGAWRHLSARGRVFGDATGKGVRVVGTCLDITTQKRAEEAIRQSNEALTRSNRELEQFASVASHDLQEPLRMVSSYTQLLARRYEGKLDQDAMDFIGFAVDGANRMQRLIQDLLEYSRVSAQVRPPAQFDASDALGLAVANLRAAIQETSALVSNDELPTVLGDRSQIAQVFQNLVANALKFRQPGQPARVHVSAAPSPDDPDFWLFRVTDNGIGIEPRYFNRLFVIFQRLHGRQEYPGNGIGLALCKRIVERHGGQIWLESKPGVGTTFFFTLPRSGPGKGLQS